MMRRLWVLGCLLALALPLSACDNGSTGTDAGTGDGGGGGDDASTPTTAAPVVVAARDGMGDPIIDREAGVAADFSCRGAVAAPTAGADATFTVTAVDFFSSETVGDLTVHFFPDNVVTPDCSGSCIEVTTDASGQAQVTAPEGGWYAYRIVAGMGTHMSIPEAYVAAVQYNEAAPAGGGTAELAAVRQSTINTLTGVLLINQQAGTSIVTGIISDCNGDAVANARIRLFDANGEIALGTARTGPKSFYFNGESFPNASERATHVDGLYGAGNIPVPTDGLVRVELWGAVTAGGEPELLGCERVQAVGDGLTIINVGPTRSDGPSDCSG